MTSTFFTPWQDLSLGAQSSIARYQYTIIASNPDDVARCGEVMRRRIAGLPEISDIIANNDTVGLEAHLAIDRVRSAALGVTPAEIDSILYDAFGQRQVKTLYFPHNYRRVVLEVIDLFGVERCMFGSNYPVDSLCASYQSIFEGFAACVSGFSEQDRSLLFVENARRLYRIAG